MSFEVLRQKVERDGLVTLSYEARMRYKRMLHRKKRIEKRKPPRIPSVVPLDGWQIADPEFEYVTPDRETQFQGTPLRNRHISFESLLLEIFVPVLAPFLRDGQCKMHDGQLFLALGFDIWWRTNRDGRDKSLARVFAKLQHPNDEMTQAYRRSFAPLSNAPGKTTVKHFHQLIRHWPDMSATKAAIAGYNAAMRKLLLPPRSATVDEKVLHSHAQLLAKYTKPNDTGMQFYEIATRVRVAYARVILVLDLSWHRPGTGPSIAQTTIGMLESAGFLDDDLPVCRRPVITCDSAFTTKEFLHFLLAGEPKLPFILSFKSTKLQKLYNMLEQRALAARRRVLPQSWTNTLLMQRDGEPFPTENDASNPFASHSGRDSRAATSSSAVAQTGRPQRATAGKRSFGDAFVVDDVDLSESDNDDAVSETDSRAPPAQVPTKQRLHAEWSETTDKDTQTLRRICFLTNYVNPVPYHDGHEIDPEGELTEMFRTDWDDVDKTNKLLKENLALHSLPQSHHMTDTMLAWDWLLSNAIWSARVIDGARRDARVHPSINNGQLQLFGEQVTQFCVKMYQLLGARTARAQTVI